MARKKVNLQYIANDSARRATFKKRRASLMKKASELATLCDVDACVVVYGEGASHPEVWPPSATDAARVLGRFKAMPEMEQCKKMMDMEGFLRQRVAKLKEQLEKARRDNHARETAILLHDAIAGRRPGLIAGLSTDDFASLGSIVKTRLEEVTNAIQRLHEQGHGDPATALQLSLASLAPQPVPYTAGAGHTEVVNAPEPDPQGWLLDVAKTGGFGGESGSLGGGDAGASTSGGLGDMLKLGNAIAGHPGADQGGPSFPPPM